MNIGVMVEKNLLELAVVKYGNVQQINLYK
jgi:hypothetical protein